MDAVKETKANLNLSVPFHPAGSDEHVFDNPYIRGAFILLYTIMFLLCFFGNLAVVLVVTLHWKMRNVTKFFLGNLALANLSVSIFCIYQSLTTYLYESWLYGDFMCKMYHFTQSLCHAASVFILIAIAVERYLVFLHPFTSRQLLTLPRLAMIIIGVWSLSAAVSAPRLYYFGTATVPIYGGKSEKICIPKKSKYHSPTADTVYFVLIYAIPLCILTFLYSRIVQRLCKYESLRRRLISKSLRTTTNEISGGSITSTVHYDGHQARITGFTARITRGRWDRMMPVRRESLCKHFRERSSSTVVATTEPTFSTLARSCPCCATMWSLKSTVYSVSWNGDGMLVDGKKKGSLIVVISGRIYYMQNPRSHDRTTPRPRKAGWRSTWPPPSHHRGHGRPSLEREINETYAPCAVRKRQHLMFPNRSVTINHCLRGKECAKAMARRHQILRGFSRIQNQRRMAIRLLIVTVISFALLNLPFHIRKLCLNYWRGYNANSDWSHLISPLTFLLMYANCALDPILYAFMSIRFRQSFRDLIKCKQR